MIDFEHQISRDTRKPVGFSTWSDTNRPVQSQQKARSLKSRIVEEQKLCHQCSEKVGADQLCSYCTVEMRLCFRI